MVEPSTVGALVTTVLAMAGEAVLRGAAGEAVKDGYKALKERVCRWGSDEVVALATTPASPARQAVIAKIIDARSDEERQALRVLAETLVAHLKECPSAIGLDLGRLNNVAVQLGAITVEGGIGARIKDATGGTITTGDIRVGTPPGK